MEQDEQAIMGQARTPFYVVPFVGQTQRATNFEVRFDGGAFTLHLFEFRESAEPRLTPLVENWESVEVGRFALSPVALARISAGIAAAGAAYTAVMGRSVPTEEEIANGLAAYSGTVQSPQPKPPPQRKKPA